MTDETDRPVVDDFDDWERSEQRFGTMRNVRLSGFKAGHAAGREAMFAALWHAGWRMPFAARVQPTRDEIAETLATTGDDSWCFQRIRDWNALEQWERDAQPQEEPFSDYEERDWYLARADRILALFSSAPTVAQVRAEALREAAVEYASGRLTGVFMGRDDYTRAWLCARADALDPKEEN